MKKKPEAPIRPWKLPVRAPELLSLHTEIAYRGGAARKAIQPVKYVFSGREAHAQRGKGMNPMSAGW
ncbi:hypothetical protein ACFX19_022974 [Malus domestica]